MFVNLIAPINQLGYGVVGYNVLKKLHDRNHVVSYFPLGKIEWQDNPNINELIKEVIQNAQRYDSSAPCVRIWHQHELNAFVGKGKRIGWPIFELNRFKDEELHQLQNVDELFVCSEWAKAVCEDNGVEVPVHVVPLGVDPELFYVDEKAEEVKPWWTKDSTIFINVGKWEVRKGHEELCEAFSKAFTPEDDVQLWMLNENPFLKQNNGNEMWKRKYISSPMGSKIRIIDRVNTQAELRYLFNHADCGVFPAHAEGWNLEILELMACGAQIIATDYSGHTEYLNKDNSYLLDVTGIESANDGIWFHGDGQWCSFSTDQLVEAMRAVHDGRQSGNFKTKPEAIKETVEKFTWDNTIKEMEKAL